MLLLVFLVWSFVNPSSCFFNVYPKIKQISFKGDPGEPLYLTPLIEAGKIKEAQSAANVGPLKGAENITSFSGYLTVNKKFNSNLFFWFFPVESNNYPSAPVVLWLQGGPGSSSLFGLFTENGPFSVNSKYYLKLRKYSWTKTHSVIYIDNPVGTGYSFTESDDGYARNETAVGEDLYNALLQFFQLFPELQQSEFYVTGESYAGKYVPALSYTIHTKNPGAKQVINFKGMAIGNGLCDPEHMLKYGDYLYQIGLIDVNGRTVFHKMEDVAMKYIQEKKWNEAFDVFDKLLNGDVHGGTVLYNLTGFSFYFNYLHHKGEGNDALGTYIQLAKVRKAIHVGNLTFHTDNKVEEHLKQDIMQSVKPWVEILLEEYRVLIYNGQLDIIVAYPLTLGFLQALDWSGAAAYKTAPRLQWHVGNDLAGYAKSVNHLTEILVRDAGHMVPSDQSKWAFDLINRFTANKPFH
ncbi:Venom serine carboxypeptidase [Cryptotermes secundus]|uniref:Carboxypeptidase n=2 Tax=Cryptotermes secundus TaxID=105785 RepID=A0A2J7RDU7_9NEOP|nr:venom serine carboxypeptidase [Cryptotermes secundus]PNF39003.1 Venom serine carboxypeptidase [Cryptotermes secundus]